MPDIRNRQVGGEKCQHDGLHAAVRGLSGVSRQPTQQQHFLVQELFEADAAVARWRIERQLEDTFAEEQHLSLREAVLGLWSEEHRRQQANRRQRLFGTKRSKWCKLSRLLPEAPGGSGEVQQLCLPPKSPYGATSLAPEQRGQHGALLHRPRDISRDHLGPSEQQEAHSGSKNDEWRPGVEHVVFQLWPKQEDSFQPQFYWPEPAQRVDARATAGQSGEGQGEKDTAKYAE